MASISQVLTRPNSTTFSLSSTSPCPFTPKTLLPIPTPKTHRATQISCKSVDNNEPAPKVDRRDILVGLGGLSAAALTLSSSNDAAIADPFPLPSFSKCQQANLPDAALPPTNCCPSFRSNFTDFELPARSLPLRIRPAAHLANGTHITKYNKAIDKMKNLQCADPRSFVEQAKIHCAYCQGFYPQDNSTDPLQIHFSSLFFPWHRLYLYFYERILCNMIDDDTFAIPFWNWDARAGMSIPPMFANKDTKLYDPLRDPTHLNTVINLSYSTDPAPVPDEQRIQENLVHMNRQLVNKSTDDFLGDPYKSGSGNSGIGSVESSPHGDIHVWTGDPTKGGQNMGRFYSAGRDPIFYAHHANIDRLWTVWKQLGGQDYTDTDWLDASFLFFDEKAQLKKVKVSHAIDSTKLRYNYQDVPLEWIDTPPTVTRRGRAKRSAAPPALTDLSSFPVTLSSVIHVRVPRPKAEGGQERKEVLVVEGIEIEPDELASFNVFINTPDHEQIRPTGRELAGSFVTLPLHHKITTSMRFALTDLLKELGSDGDEDVLVTIVPKQGIGKMKLGGLHIEFK